MARTAPLFGLLITLGALFHAPAALASSNYPAFLRDKLALAKTPDCTLCHRDDNGGTGTVVTPFGETLQAYGLRSNDTASLEAALSADSARGTDSDGDGVSDIDELKAGTDPNDGPGQSLVVSPEHGCAVAGPTGREGLLGRAAWFGLACVVALGRRRRKLDR